MQILCAEMAAHSCELLLKWRRCDNLIDWFFLIDWLCLEWID
jgi:hypothetical protein